MRIVKTGEKIAGVVFFPPYSALSLKRKNPENQRLSGFYFSLLC